MLESLDGGGSVSAVMCRMRGHISTKQHRERDWALLVRLLSRRRYDTAECRVRYAASSPCGEVRGCNPEQSSEAIIQTFLDPSHSNGTALDTTRWSRPSYYGR